MKIVRTTFFSIGSNVGDRLGHLQQAVDELNAQVGHIVRLSSVYQSSSWGYEGEEFLNMCVEVSTSLTPEMVLEKILAIESGLGRTRKPGGSYEDRILDIDLLFFEDEVIFYDELKVPHPRMLERRFVLLPLSEIAPNFIHPIAKKSIQSCLESCPDKGLVEKIDQSVIKPLTLLDKYNYIAIEGNIGSGKTSLTKKIQNIVQVIS